MEHAVYMAGVFHELDPVTPVTIGAAFSDNMIEMGEAQDVLSFHNYLPTRAAIRADIAKAKAYSAKVNKPLINTEIGCIARANPYDVTIEEHMKANVGWYIWELMITHQWGYVHGVFHPDGTIRDPAIVAALFGMFRDRPEDVMPALPDREGAVTRAVSNGKKWLADANAAWEAGLDLAEISPNLLESGQLIAMCDPPTRTVEVMATVPFEHYVEADGLAARLKPIGEIQGVFGSAEVADEPHFHLPYMVMKVLGYDVDSVSIITRFFLQLVDIQKTF